MLCGVSLVSTISASGPYLLLRSCRRPEPAWLTDSLAHERGLCLGHLGKNVTQIAARSQRLTKPSRSQNEKPPNRVALKVKIESFSECGILENQRDSRVVLKVAPHAPLFIVPRNRQVLWHS